MPSLRKVPRSCGYSIILQEHLVIRRSSRNTYVATAQDTTVFGRYDVLTRSQEQGETALVDRANQKAQHILHNLDDAITYILNGENTEQNRNKQVMSNSTPWQRPPIAASSGGSIGSLSRPQNSFAAFGQPSQPAGAGAFGRPSVLSGSGASTGGAAFGAPSIPGIQSSPFGTPAVRPAFGTPSAFGIAAQPQSSGFGAPSSLGNQPSPFAAASQNNPQTSSGPGSVFGGGSNGGQTNAFAAPKAAIPSFATLGQSPHLAGSTAFGQASQLGGGGGFGQASSAGGGGGFGQAPTIAKPLQSSSPFAQASGSSSQSSTSVGFGAPSLPGTSSGFGAPSQPGSSNPFGMRSQPANNAFAAAHPTSFPGVPQPATNGLGNASDTTRDSSGRLLKWKGRPVQYNGDSVPFYQHPGTGKRERIWIEKGQPPSHPDFEGVIEAYEGERGTMLKTIYDFLGETGTFKDGLVPEIPPKRDWIRWDV